MQGAEEAAGAGTSGCLPRLALLDALQRIHSQQGLGGLAEHLCQIETLWHSEETDPAPDPAVDTVASGDPLDQLDLLLDEIRGGAEDPATPWLPLQGEAT